MSEATIVVSQYQTASALSESFCRALTDVKQAQLRMPGSEQLTPVQIDIGRQTLLKVLKAVELGLRGTYDPASPYVISGAMQAWIDTAYRTTSSKTADLARIQSRLEQIPTALDQHDFSCLDQLMLIFDAHAAHLFHRTPVAVRVR